MSKQRGVGFRVLLGLLVLQLVNVLASGGILVGYRFPHPDRIILVVADLIPVVAFVVMIAMVFARVRRGRNIAINRIALAYLVLATLQSTLNVFFLVSSGRPDGESLLWGLGVLGGAYLQVVAVFAGWYWLLDHTVPGGAFVFPETESKQGFVPNLIDYLFISFNTNSTFGPTAETILDRKVKLLMMLQTALSLAILLVFVARIVGFAT